MWKKTEKMCFLTCYDSAFAQIMKDLPIDGILIGDSVANVIYGEKHTTTCKLDWIYDHTMAVSSKVSKIPIISDMPFLSNRKGIKHCMDIVEKLIASGANAIKIEGCTGNQEIIKHIIESGVPVVGHLGLTPQFVNAFGGYKVQGKDLESQEKLKKDIVTLNKLGVSAIVLECIPSSLAKELTQLSEVPTIGIGAGADVDGQILVLHDLLGFYEKTPKFVSPYLNIQQLTQDAITQWTTDVKEQKFPSEDQQYK